jgi:Reverse transcriptase (RNA-dependent DNA polymerase)
MSIISPSPKKIRPFAPFIPSHNRLNSVSPPPDMSSGLNSTPLPASSGMFLLIRNVLPPNNKTGFGKPVELVTVALTEVLTSDDGNELVEVTVVLTAGGRPQDPHCSSVYLELSQQTKSLDPLPRPDLLRDWKVALSKVRPDWEIVWAPQKKGKDRRMTVRFKVADTKEMVPISAADKIRAHLESKGIRTTGGYISFNGLVDISLADSHSVDKILDSNYYLIPSLSKDGIPVSPPKYFTVNHPFELCIGGINEYEGLHEIIDKWLLHTYVYLHDDGTKSSRLLETRVSNDREHLTFAMDSWESTLLVLKDIELFRAFFALSPLITDPKLLFELNSTGFARKNMVTTINSGAGSVNTAIADMKRELSDFRKEQTENNCLVQRQVSTLHVSLDNQSNAIAHIGNQLHQCTLSMLASRDEKAIEGKISVIDNSLNFETQCLRSTKDPAEIKALQQTILDLKADRREQITRLSEAGEKTLKLIGPAPGVLVPAPPTPAARAESHAFIVDVSNEVAPNEAFNHNPFDDDPVSAHDSEPTELPPARQPSFNPHAVSVPHTPARMTRTPTFIADTPLPPTHSNSSSLSSYSSFTSNAANVDPLIFNFNSMTTPTNSSVVRNPVSTKRAKHADAPESPTKRVRSSDRLSGARNVPKPNPSAPPADNGARDVFGNKSAAMVCLYSLTAYTSLTTAYADQGYRPRSGLRPRSDQWSTPKKHIDMHDSSDRLGRVCHADSSIRKSFCRSITNKSTPYSPFWFIVIILFLSCISVVSAAATSPAAALSFFALNTNGFVHPTKIDATNRAISHRSPDIFVITETKTNSSCTSKMDVSEYQMFEERGTAVTGHHLYKWGAILGIKKSISVSQRVPISHPALKGRLIAADIVIPLESGMGFTHRIIAAYAPWNVSDSSDTAAFWSETAKFCNSTHHHWTLLGDLNATVTQAERRSGGSDARTHYLNFLRQAKGFDLWSNYPERSRMSDWTCKPRLSTDGGSIIDRIVTSSLSFLDTEIYVADGFLDFVPMTDHRPIIGRIILKPPERNSARCLHERPTPILNTPRIKFPEYKDKHLFQVFRDETDARVKSDGLRDRTVSDDISFIALYRDLTKIINDSAVHVFGRIKRRKPVVHKTVTNMLIQQLQGRSRAIGGALRLDNDPNFPPSFAAKNIHTLSSLEFLNNPSGHTSLRSLLLAKRKSINQQLYRERSNEIYARAKRYDSFRISQALAGGSTKRLVQAAEFVPLPMSINTIDGSGKLLTSPDEVMEETRRYWNKLYARQPIPPMEKPWLVTKSVKEVYNRVSANPFIWPKSASLPDFRALIRRGNTRPSPGPDGTEKWCIKSLSDFSLTPFLVLHNYMIANSCFPGDIKDMYLTMFHKRGLRTDLNNWRGLMISNFLANSPMTWLNYLLTPYIAANSILPDTQVATQQGVQTRDLTSFLSGAMTWANRHKTTVYALKRDQMKGFDYLAPEGFYDAVSAYGLPQAIADIDKAAQTNTKVFIRTAHGLTEPILVSGVAKQGGPISPLKSTLTTSLGHRLLDDIANVTPGALTIKSSTHERHDPHLPIDNLSLDIRMIEATDDSIIFARTIPALQSLVLLAERFQYAYGWLTNWLKTTAYVLSPTGVQPCTLSMPSITVAPGVSPLVISNHDVPLIPNELDFLRVKINNPANRFRELQDFIEAFNFPKFVGPTPITLIRKIVMQSIASRARALLSFQPVSDTDAIKLDRFVAAKVHAISGFPWIFNSEIATLPVSLHGSEFPSIRRINASIAVDGLARDLNHHIISYRNMALITLADWTCTLNNCINPLVEPGILKNFSRRMHFNTIPAAWIIAQKEMGNMKPPLSLHSTDQSHILNGDVSISHVTKILKTYDNDTPSGSSSYSLRKSGIRLVSQLGVWRPIDLTLKFIPHTLNEILRTFPSLTSAGRKNLNKITLTLSHSTINMFSSGSADLLVPRLQRQVDAEQYILALEKTCKFPPSLCPHTGNTWATDGSMIPASSSISEPKTITAAATGPHTLLLQVVHRNASILHGEQMGLLSALILADPSPKIYTDHMNSANLIADNRSAVNQELRLRSMNGRSYYRWMLDLVSRKLATVTYTKAHTDDISLPAILNSEADHYASSAQKAISSIPLAPIPTFFMNQYTFHRQTDGWIESNIRYFIDHFSAKATAERLALLPKHRMSTWLYDMNPPPPWVYTKASSAYTALVQLYARSGQLPTAEGMFLKKSLHSPICRFGCPETESPHHIFVECGRFSELRSKELVSLTTTIKNKLGDANLNPIEQSLVLDTVKFTFSDSESVWPLHSASFFLGQIPKIEPLISPLSINNSVTRSRLIHNVAADIHLSSVRLASRIFGDYQKVMSNRHAANGRTK